MCGRDIAELLDGVGDPAFVVDCGGIIRYVNSAAAELLAPPPGGLVGASCFRVMQLQDACGDAVCQELCVVREKVLDGKTTPAFEAEAVTVSGRRWVNVSTAIVRTAEGQPLIMHVLREVQTHKRIEQLTRQFLGQIGALSGDTIETLLSPGAAPHHDLSQQERAVLKLLVQGQNTKDIADTLNISHSTTRNHVEHILHKLNAHSRLEAVVRAIREKLV